MDELLIKYLLGEASPEERVRVGQWLAADRANRERYEQFKAVWAISGKTVPAGSSDTGLAWRQMQQKLRRREAVAGNGKTVPAGSSDTRIVSGARMGRMGRMAAVFVGILLLSGTLYLILLTHRPAPALTRASVAVLPPPVVGKPANQQFFAGNSPLTDTLPDRSVVTLNKGASLSYIVRGMDQGLTVRLKGEGFFSIVPHPSRPFVVEVNTITIKVLGTSFELKANGRDSAVLIVETGAVEVSRGRGSLVLQKGERLSMVGNRQWKKEPNRDHLYGYYLGRPLVCDSTSLRRVVEVLNEKYGAHIVIGRRQLEDLPLTTVFRRESPDRILQVIAATFHLSIVRQGQTILLR